MCALSPLDAPMSVEHMTCADHVERIPYRITVTYKIASAAPWEEKKKKSILRPPTRKKTRPLLLTSGHMAAIII